MACYGCEVRLLKTEEQRKLLALEMDYLRRQASVQITKNLKHHYQEQNANRTINFRQNSKKAIEMEDSRWPKKIYQWISHDRRRRGRPQNTWKNQVTNFMRRRHGRR